MNMNKKLLGALVVVLSTSCGKSKYGSETGVETQELSLVNALPVGENLSENKEEVNNLINGLDYSKDCSDEGVSCNGIWVLKQARCNDEPFLGGFKNEPVIINIKGDTAELQAKNGKIESFGLSVNTFSVLSFTRGEEVIFSKNYTSALSEGIMNIYHGANEECAAGAKSIYTRLGREASAALIQKSNEIAAEKSKEDAARAEEEEACSAFGREQDEKNNAETHPEGEC